MQWDETTPKTEILSHEIIPFIHLSSANVSYIAENHNMFHGKIHHIYIYMWQGPFGIMRTIACFKHPTPASVLVPFLSPCLPPCSLQLVPLLLFLPLSCCPSLCMYILDAQVSLFSICLRACLPLFSSGSVLSFLPNH